MVPRPRQRDGASTIPPITPEHQQFPLPLIRAEIVPEAPFVALSGHTCRREVRARGPHRGKFGVEVESARLDDAFRKVATFFFFGVMCKCLWVAPVSVSKTA